LVGQGLILFLQVTLWFLVELEVVQEEVVVVALLNFQQALHL
jgi:hypothetical protein